MSHEDAGHYKAKHPAGTKVHPEAAAILKKRNMEGRISCVEAHTIAGECGISPEETGKTIDLMEIRITECQLGLFGYKKEKRNIVVPPEEVPEAVKARLKDAAKEGRITCLALWQAADDLSLSRLEISGANEALGFKICCCQLGAF